MNNDKAKNLEPVQLLPLTSDIVFKQVFGQEESKPILRVFLNDVLGLNIESPDQITLLNPTINPKQLDDKMCILDIRVQLSDRSNVDVEIQVLNRHNMELRALYYTCQLYSKQLHSGDDYAQAAPVYGLNLLCFDLYKDPRYYRNFILKDEETNEPYSQKFEITFFELRKAVRQLSKTMPVKELELSKLPARDQWALFINSGEKEVYETLIAENETFEQAYERLKEMSSDKELMELYQSREKALHDWNDSMHSAKKEGIEEEKYRIKELYLRLIQDQREADIPKMITDSEFQEKLLNEYGIK